MADTNPLSPDFAERIGRLADRLDAALYSAKLPLPDSIHKGALTEIVRDVRDGLVAIVRNGTGADPWADNPMEG